MFTDEPCQNPFCRDTFGEHTLAAHVVTRETFVPI
jgi:hypothetical protein